MSIQRCLKKQKLTKEELENIRCEKACFIYSEIAEIDKCTTDIRNAPSFTTDEILKISQYEPLHNLDFKAINPITEIDVSIV